MSQESYYITTPIYYVNDKPHLGHAYTSVACDVLARFMRLDGRNVKFLTGTDEHGQKVEKSADAAGVPPQSFVDEVSEHFRDMVDVLDLTNDDFIRTTEGRHKRAAQAIWNQLKESGDIYLGSYAGWYSVRDEAFYAESELVDGKAPTGAEVEWVEEPSYFFKLSKYQEPLLKLFKENPDFNQILMAQMALGMIVGIYLAPVPALLVESFPTSIRFTGMALSYNICAIVGGLTPAVSTWLISETGNNDSIMFVLLGSAVASFIGLLVYQDRWKEPLTAMR